MIEKLAAEFARQESEREPNYLSEYNLERAFIAGFKASLPKQDLALNNGASEQKTE